jgi:uncharacterized membrane protein (UPF0127 family)
MLKDKTTKNILTKEIVHLKSFPRIGTGLMFRSKESCKDKAFIFHLNPKRKYSITMWFVFFPLDLIFLDKNKKVVEIKNDIKPFTIYRPKTRFKYMVELLPANRNVKIGDVLEIN